MSKITYEEFLTKMEKNERKRVEALNMFDPEIFLKQNKIIENLRKDLKDCRILLNVEKELSAEYKKLFEDAELRLEKEKEGKHLKGYMFDSLIMRYEKARYAQALAEARLWKEENKYNSFPQALEKANNLAQRDKMRFIQILDEAIGEHD